MLVMYCCHLLHKRCRTASSANLLATDVVTTGSEVGEAVAHEKLKKQQRVVMMLRFAREFCSAEKSSFQR